MSSLQQDPKESGSRPTIAVSSWSLHERISRHELSIFEFPRFAAERLHLKNVEVVLSHLLRQERADFEKLAEAAAKEGVRIVCLALDNDFTIEGPKEHKRECKRVEDLLESAVLLGAGVARLNPGMKRGTPEELAQRIARGVKAIFPVAEELRIKLALENHQLFGMRPDNILRVLDLVPPSAKWGICLDFGGFHREDLETGPARLIARGTPLHIHAKSYSFSEDSKSEKRINYLERMRELKAAGYKGYLSIEWERPVPEAPAEKDDDVNNVFQTRRLIETCLERLK